MTKRSKTVQRVEDDVFVAIAHPVRRQLLHQLVDGEQPVKTLCEPFDMSRSAVGQHLDVLLSTGLVQREKRGRQQYYRLIPESLDEVREWVAYFEQHWKQKLDSLEAFLDDQETES